MSKLNVHYFQVSNTHYSQPHSVRIIQKYNGWFGYGVYLTVCQLLASAPDRKIKLADLPQVAYVLRLTYDDKFVEMIKFMFVVEGDYFYSTEVNESVASLIKKVANLNPSAAGKASAEARRLKKLETDIQEINSKDSEDS